MNNEQDFMLTTIDNPFNPYVQFDEWFAFDTQKGYHTCQYLARIATVTDSMTDRENEYEISRAIDEIVNENTLGIYMKISPPV